MINSLLFFEIVWFIDNEKFGSENELLSHYSCVFVKQRSKKCSRELDCEFPSLICLSAEKYSFSISYRK